MPTANLNDSNKTLCQTVLALLLLHRAQVSVGAILEVLLRTLGRDDVSFSIGSEGTPWLTRSYKTLTSAAKEVGGEGHLSQLTAGLFSLLCCWRKPRTHEKSRAQQAPLGPRKEQGMVVVGYPGGVHTHTMCACMCTVHIHAHTRALPGPWVA